MIDALTLLAVMRQQRESQLEMLNHMIEQAEQEMKATQRDYLAPAIHTAACNHYLDLKTMRGMATRHKQEIDRLVSGDLEELYQAKRRQYASNTEEIEEAY